MLRSAKSLKTEQKILSKDVLSYFSTLEWQGNVRQLENVCHWLTVMVAGNTVNISDLPSELQSPSDQSSSFQGQAKWSNGLEQDIKGRILEGKENIYETYIEMVEKILIEKALEHTKRRKIDAARILGIGRNTITRKINELDIK